VTGCLTVPYLVTVNPWPVKNFVKRATKKTLAPRLRSLRSESKSFFFLKCTHGIIKQAVWEAGSGVSGKWGRMCGVSNYQGWKYAWFQHTSIYRKRKRMRTGASVDKEKIKEEIKQELKDET
jgi:hypothetical protein